MIRKSGFYLVICLFSTLSLSLDSRADVQQITLAEVRIKVKDKVYVLAAPLQMTRYTLADGREGCNGEKYGYDIYNAPPQWPIDGLPESLNEDYWDWVYEGYEGGGNPDWSKNCHAYAFNLNDWPHDSANLKSGGGVQCWIDDMSNATIADNTIHTIKITVENCPMSIGKRITYYAEKFQESAVYHKSSSCFGQQLFTSVGNGPRSGMALIPHRENN
ncbi:MAG: hypothetical protein ACK5YR_11595 [Pirellula sp.]